MVSSTPVSQKCLFTTSTYLSPFLFPLQSKGLKCKGNGGKRSRRGRRARFLRSDEPEQSSDSELYGESKEIVHSLLPCCGARKTLPLDGARLRFSTAATLSPPSPCPRQRSARSPLPDPPRSRYVPGESSSPIPRSARIRDCQLLCSAFPIIAGSERRAIVPLHFA